MISKTLEEIKEFVSTMSNQKFTDELSELLDEDDEKVYESYRWLRDLASEKYDFTGHEHVNCYTKENYINGTLRALENTRSRLSITSAEKLIDYLFIFGYSIKRILFILLDKGYMDFNRHVVGNYLRINKKRLEKERQNLMDELDKNVKNVFQQMKGAVMTRERETLEILLEKLDKLNRILEKIDPESEFTKFNRIRKTIEEVQVQVNKMNGIEQLRETTTKVAGFKSVEGYKRALSMGILDELLKEENKPALTNESGLIAIDAQVTRL